MLLQIQVWQGTGARRTAISGILCLACATAVCGDEPAKGDVAATFSLADDFSLATNRAGGVWSFRLIDEAKSPGSWPLLVANQRTANELWGSNFNAPPRMWSDATGYWGIGRNDTPRELFSTSNETSWSPGGILLHARGGESPRGLAICWTAPRDLWIDVRFSFAVVASGSNGVGFRLAKHSPV